MRFDIHLQATVRQQIADVAAKMKGWEEHPQLSDSEKARVYENIVLFNHTIRRTEMSIGAADGSGDYPAISYADSFVYVSVAQAAHYQADSVTGLLEPGPVPDQVVDIAWIPENEAERRSAFDQSFAALTDMSLRELIALSDYRFLKDATAHKRHTIDELLENLVRPHAADAGNIGLQLRSTAELAALLRLVHQPARPTYLLMDGTFALPLVSRKQLSLFYEHLKRFCCVAARQSGIGFFALSKSHGLPAMEIIEELTRTKAGADPGQVAEHWYLRLPLDKIDDWQLELTNGRQLPPVGAVTYLVRFHHSTPVMRLDMDIEYWRQNVRGASAAITQANEVRIFQDLDYASHDQRCYGYPYPLKAAHDRVSLTQAERVALRKQIIDAALQVGMKRALFRDASQMTGHR